jgi:excisionase family DNA binding protein
MNATIEQAGNVAVPQPFDFEGLWDVDDTARALKVSKSLVYRMAGRGELPSLKVSNRLRFNPAEIENWVQERMVVY